MSADILIESRLYVLYRDRLFFELSTREFVDFSRAELFFEVEVASSYVQSNPGAIVLTYDPDEYDPKFQFRTLDWKVFDVLKSSPTSVPKESTMAVGKDNTNSEILDSQGSPFPKAGLQERLSERSNQRSTASRKPTNRSQFQAKTGDRNTDRNHPEFHDFNSKEAKPPRASTMATIGDFAVKIKDIFLDANFSVTAGLLAAGGAMTVSVIGYISAFSPYLVKVVALPGIAPVWFLPITIGVPALAAFMVQRKELLPILPKIFPDKADELAFKLASTKFVEASDDANSPTLLRSVKGWARRAAANNQRSGELVRWGLYGFEFFMAMSQFGSLLFTGNVLSIALLFLIAYAVLGCELSFRYVAGEEQKRLGRRDSRRYRELKQKHRREAEARIR